MADTHLPAAQCFLSYHRPDNLTYDSVVDQLKADLAGRFAAESGRPLHVFVDRDDIPGGVDWREKITGSIEAATIFIPVVTMRYFESEACREELLAFYDGANALGVTELILPVILAGRQNILATDPRPEVRIIERLNYRPIDEAVDCGYHSPEWKSAVRVLVTDVAGALARAEDAIASREESRGDLAASSVDTASERGGTEAETGDASLLTDEGSDLIQIVESMEGLPLLVEHATGSTGLLASVVESHSVQLGRFIDLNATEQKVLLLHLANDLKPISGDIARDGEKLENEVRRIDTQLREIFTQLGEAGGIAADLQHELFAQFADLDIGDAVEQVDELIEMLSTFAVLSVSLRKSLAPAIRGLRAIRSATSIAASWRALT